MTDEAKRFLNLKEDAQALREIEWTDCAMNPRVCTTMMHKAADLIESLSAELESVKYERDAAVEDVSGYCATCAFVDDCAKHDLNDSAPYFRWFYGDCEDWQWRGVKEGSDA